MSDTGRFYTRINGRLFCIEPIDNRGQMADWGTYNDQQKHVGSVRPEESIITEENGFKNIVTLPPGSSPIDYIEQLVKRES